MAGDPLRGIAAMAVLLHHAAFGVALSLDLPGDPFSTSYGEHAGQLFRALDAGLFLFFVLSGYLLARPFLVAIVERRPLPAAGPYAVNRLLRIVPAFWAVLLVTLLVRGTGGSNPGEILAVFGFLQGQITSPFVGFIGQGWTLHVELFFYLALPLVSLALVRAATSLSRRRNRVLLVVAFAITAALVSLAFRASWPEETVYLRSFTANAFAFVPGILLAAGEVVALHYGADRRWVRLAAVLAVPVAVGGLVLHGLVPMDEPAKRGVVALIAATAAVAGPLAWQWSTGGAWRVLDNRFMQWLGSRSYGIYLWHWLLGLSFMGLIAGIGPTWAKLAVLLGVVVPATFVTAELSWRIIERPALRLRPRRTPVEGGGVAGGLYPTGVRKRAAG